MSPVPAPDPNGLEVSQGSWREWARHVLIELERLNTFQETITLRIQENQTVMDNKLGQLRQELQQSIANTREGTHKDLSDIRIELAMLKMKAGAWGAIGASIPILITLVIALVVHYITKGDSP